MTAWPNKLNEIQKDSSTIIYITILGKYVVILHSVWKPRLTVILEEDDAST